MGGFLVLGRNFRSNEDSCEFVCDDKLSWGTSYGGIKQMIDAGTELGIPREAWPNFIDCDGRPDLVTVDQIAELNRQLRAAMSTLVEKQVAHNEELLNVWRYVQQGYDLFIDN